jgi:hypothetical protein
MHVLANSPAPLPVCIPFPKPIQNPVLVELEKVVMVLKKEGVKPEVILAVRELELYS